MFYRYEAHMVSRGVDQWDESLGSYLQLSCYEFAVSKITPKGTRIIPWVGEGDRAVLDSTINKYAYPTKVEALLGFIARKKRQQSILLRQYSRSRQAEQKAEQLLAKEMQC